MKRIQGVVTRLLEKAVLPLATMVQTYSNANADFWSAELGRRVTMIRPAWRSSEAQSAVLSDRGLVVGRVQRWKGPQVVCEAMELLGDAAPFLDWIGHDTVWGERNLSATAFLGESYPSVWGRKIIHHEPLSSLEIAERQAGASFNLVPSTWDVFNFTTIEGMASGRPTIVSTGAGASELVEDGVNGFLFPAGDANGLAAAIKRLMSESPVHLAEIGRAAQATVQAALDPERIAVKRIAALRAAIEDFKLNSPAPIGGWLGDICRPSAESTRDSMTFLDHHPLRSIFSYSARRLGRRLSSQ